MMRLWKVVLLLNLALDLQHNEAAFNADRPRHEHAGDDDEAPSQCGLPGNWLVGHDRLRDYLRATTDFAGGSGGTTRSITTAASRPGTTRLRRPVARASMRFGDRSVSISSRR